VDFFLENGSGQLFINEVNTFPSFTKQCLYPKLCDAIGLPYPQLLEYLIDLALERHADRQCNHSSVHIDTLPSSSPERVMAPVTAHYDASVYSAAPEMQMLFR
jgi:D-ala D-ala ligase C-terminus